MNIIHIWFWLSINGLKQLFFSVGCTYHEIESGCLFETSYKFVCLFSKVYWSRGFLVVVNRREWLRQWSAKCKHDTISVIAESKPALRMAAFWKRYRSCCWSCCHGNGSVPLYGINASNPIVSWSYPIIQSFIGPLPLKTSCCYQLIC